MAINTCETGQHWRVKRVKEHHVAINQECGAIPECGSGRGCCISFLARWISWVPPPSTPPTMIKYMRSYSCAVPRLQLDWPQEQETPKCSKLEDTFLSGGQVEGPERWSLPCFEDLHDELTCSWGKPYSFHVFVLSTLTYSTIFSARACDYTIMTQVE